MLATAKVIALASAGLVITVAGGKTVMESTPRSVKTSNKREADCTILAESSATAFWMTIKLFRPTRLRQLTLSGARRVCFSKSIGADLGRHRIELGSFLLDKTSETQG
jgi:hypothetical protein